MDDIVSLLLYILMILAAFIASAYQAKKRRSQQGQGPPASGNKEPWQKTERPDLGPLGDFFDMQEMRESQAHYETLEAGPSVEEEGAGVERSVAYEPMTPGAVSERNKAVIPPESPEEGQTDLTQMRSLDEDMGLAPDEEILEDIAAGEIVSEEKAAEIAAQKAERVKTDWRKAIIYSEILKRKEY